MLFTKISDLYRSTRKLETPIQWDAHGLKVVRDGHLEGGTRVHFTEGSEPPQMLSNAVVVGIDYRPDGLAKGSKTCLLGGRFGGRWVLTDGARLLKDFSFVSIGMFERFIDSLGEELDWRSGYFFSLKGERDVYTLVGSDLREPKRHHSGRVNSPQMEVTLHEG